MRKLSLLSVVVGLAAFPYAASAQSVGDIRVEFVHGNQTDLAVTPLWFGFHNGAFDLFTTGQTLAQSDALQPVVSPTIASGVERIAEVGQTNLLADAFANFPNVPGNIQGVAAAAGNGVPPIEPGETGVGFTRPVNPSGYQYFSYLAMIVPSNDTFIGNSDPFALRVFNDLDQLIDASGLPTNVREIEVRRFYDAGTEANDPNNGGAFIPGVNEFVGASTNDPVSLFPSLTNLNGLTAANGDVINDVLTGVESELMGTIRITIVPEPSTLVLGALGLLGLCRRA